MSELYSTKRCFKCEKIKPLSGFPRNKCMRDGYSNKCKECAGKDTRQWKARFPEKVREHNRRHRVKWPEKCREHHRRWIAKFPEKAAEYQRRYRAKSPEKYRARTLLRSAVRAGKIKRQPCYHCGSLKTEAHHHDYSKPLDVRWVCFKCHRSKEHSQKLSVGRQTRKIKEEKQ